MNLNQEMVQKRKIGIMGGTFDPIHYGHLFIAETACDVLQLDKVLFIPAGAPPHKNEKLITDSNHRFQMIKVAIADNHNFEASDMEIIKEEKSYTIETIKVLRRQYGKEVNLYFITGADAFVGLETWKAYPELLGLTNFIVMTRTISNPMVLEEKISQFTEKFNTNIFKVDIPTLDISSTDIRRRVQEGRSIKYLLPYNVEKYIRDHHLYED